MFLLCQVALLTAVLTHSGGHKMHKIIHDVNTGEIFQIELSTEELAELEKKTKENLVRVEADLQIANAKLAQKAALLEKLGITAEEAKLLLS